MNKKFIKSKKINEYEVLTPNGWVNIDAIHKTVKYDVYLIKTKTHELKCADNHIVILKNTFYTEIFARQLKIGDEILTENSYEKVISIKKLNEKENMYDLELDIASNKIYYTNGIASHNTTFIRYLTSKLKKNIIFISPDMVNSITDPAFIPFLMKNNDSILIIEDAEPVLQERDSNNKSNAVSNVLNLTDGLLSDCLNISIVATFNTSKKKIDEALLRRGRLLMEYMFDKLSIEKSKALLFKLGHGKIDIKEPMTLADIYYYGTNNNARLHEIKKVGFGTQ